MGSGGDWASFTGGRICALYVAEGDEVVIEQNLVCLDDALAVAVAEAQVRQSVDSFPNPEYLLKPGMPADAVLKPGANASG